MLRSSELIFFSRWLRDPLRVGSVLPSGKALAAMLARQVPAAGTLPVIELGGGTGTVTEALLDAGVDPARLIVFERDAHLHARLVRRFGHCQVVHGDARELTPTLRGLGVESAAAVVSGLPLLSMSSATQRPILEQSFELLGAEDGFIQFTYGLRSPVARSLAAPLGLVGERRGLIWQNLPPATVWRYTRAREECSLREAAEA